MINPRIESITEDILVELKITSPKKIDVEKISKYLKVDVKAEELDDVSGFFVIKENKAYIRYNSNEGSQRQRFTIAHELGHYVLHRESKPLFVDKSEKVMYRNDDSGTGEIKKEREANAFAASLLMPKGFLKEEISRAPETDDIVSYLSQKFNVSEQAMNFRLANLGYVGLY